MNAIGWSREEDESLAELVQPHPYLFKGTRVTSTRINPYLFKGTKITRLNLLARESKWSEIGQALGKSAEECKKRFGQLRAAYNYRCKRYNNVVPNRTHAGILEKLQFLGGSVDSAEEILGDTSTMEVGDTATMEIGEHQLVETEATIVDTEEVITDNHEYYEIQVDESTVVERLQEQPEVKPSLSIVNGIKILPKPSTPGKKIGKKNVGRKKSTPMPRNLIPIKILPKPISCLMPSEPKIIGYTEEHKTPEQRSQVIDKLIEKVLKENTNEIDVFFRSMAASVKKLQPNLIPKVKMEVCNVIAKYEMQSFDRHQ